MDKIVHLIIFRLVFLKCIRTLFIPMSMFEIQVSYETVPETLCISFHRILLDTPFVIVVGFKISTHWHKWDTNKLILQSH